MTFLLDYKTNKQCSMECLVQNTWKLSDAQDIAIWRSKVERSFTDADSSASGLVSDIIVCSFADMK